MKTISSQATLLCLICLCSYQPVISSVDIHKKVAVVQKSLAEKEAKTKDLSLAHITLDPHSFSTRVQQIIAIKRHLATALSFNEPSNISIIMDNFISLEQMLSAAQTVLKIYYLDNELKSNIGFLQKLQQSIEVARHNTSINPDQLKEAFYSLPFIKKLVSQEIMNKNMLIDEATHTARPLSTNEDFKNAIQALQKDSLTRRIHPDAINWDNIEIVFDDLTEEQQPSTSNNSVNSSMTQSATATNDSVNSSMTQSATTTPVAPKAKADSAQSWLAWLRGKI